MEIRTKHFTEDGTLTTAGLRHYEKTSVTLIESGYNPKDYVVVATGEVRGGSNVRNLT